MTQPMTDAQAGEKHLCGACRAQGPGACFPGDCVLDSTCSVRCKQCGERVWFSGSLHDNASHYTCPYCSIQQYNRHLGPR